MIAVRRETRRLLCLAMTMMEEANGRFCESSVVVVDFWTERALMREGRDRIGGFGKEGWVWLWCGVLLLCFASPLCGGTLDAFLFRGGMPSALQVLCLCPTLSKFFPFAPKAEVKAEAETEGELGFSTGFSSDLLARS